MCDGLRLVAGNDLSPFSTPPGELLFMYHMVNDPPASAPAPVVVGAPSLGRQVGQAVGGIPNGLKFWK